MTPDRDARSAPRSGGLPGPLNLIHRNNSPKPVSMRVPGRFAPRLLRPVRTVLYWPLRAIPYLPGGPLRYMWLIRFVVDLDAPMRRVLAGGLYARSE